MVLCDQLVILHHTGMWTERNNVWWSHLFYTPYEWPSPWRHLLCYSLQTTNSKNDNRNFEK